MTEKQLTEKIYYAMLAKQASRLGKPQRPTRPSRVGLKYNKTKGEHHGN